jgi:CDP-diacylglycerol--serine O-phosphatidyltransferase
MVSNFPYWSGKDINLRKTVPFMFILALVFGFVFVSAYPQGNLFLLFLVYAISGYALWAWRWFKRRKSRGLSPP